jgi:hypothetical protein
MNPMLLSIYCPDDNTILLAHDAMLPKMLANHDAPKEGKMSKILEQFSSPPDALAIVHVEQLRPVIAAPLAMAPVPPPLEGAKKLPDLLTSIEVKVDLTGDPSMSLSLKANDEAAAEQVEKILDQLMDTGKQIAAAEIAKNAGKSPVEQALGQYQNRMLNKLSKVLRPVRKGEALTLAYSGGKDSQMTQVAVICVLAFMLVPAMQASRESAPHAAAQ